LGPSLTLAFSHTFSGIVWNMLANGDRLFIETRDAGNKTAMFSCVEVTSGKWLVEDKIFDEPWWVSLGGAAGDVLLLTVYTGTDNPDKKSVVAYDVNAHKVLWYRNGFALSETTSRYVIGQDTRNPGQFVALDLFTGNLTSSTESHLADSQNFTVIRPFHYEEATDHFNTVGNFLQTRMGISPLRRIEYLENNGLIIISAFVQESELANYLLVFDDGGQFLLQEKLGENLKGVALDTFFIFSGHLMFIKDKTELRAYTIL
jgi:hypothetical protein